jgi:hypothetical protein
LSAIATANAAKNNANATAADIINAINPLKAATQNLVLADQLRLAIADGWTANPASSASQSEYEFYNKICLKQNNRGTSLFGEVSRLFFNNKIQIIS